MTLPTCHLPDTGSNSKIHRWPRGWPRFTQPQQG